jgi:hypothetical protein
MAEAVTSDFPDLFKSKQNKRKDLAAKCKLCRQMQWDRTTQPRHHLKTKDRFAIMLTPPTHSSRVSMSTNLAQILEEENNLNLDLGRFNQTAALQPHLGAT